MKVSVVLEIPACAILNGSVRIYPLAVFLVTTTELAVPTPTERFGLISKVTISLSFKL